MFRMFIKYGLYYLFLRICGEYNLFRGYMVDSWILKVVNLLLFEVGYEVLVDFVYRLLMV